MVSACTAWCFILLLAILTTLINLYSVRLFAETEYWLGFCEDQCHYLDDSFRVISRRTTNVRNWNFPTLSQLTDHGGFTPHGLKGVVSSLLVVIYSYGGSELIAITVSEADEPKKPYQKR